MLELIVVMVILLLAYSLASPVIGNFGSGDLRASARTIAAALKRARNDAISTRQEVPLTFNLEERTLTLQSEPKPIKLPEKLDMVWTSNNYHDVHNVKDIDVGAFNKAIFDSLVPGGIYIVSDHAAEKGSGFAATSTLHRVDPEAVKAEVLAAGFEFVGSSDVIAMTTDDHTARVFEQGLHDKTDRFVLKFRKPKK
jgi:predicted methyltransferase